MAWKREASVYSDNPEGIATISLLSGKRLKVTYKDDNTKGFAGKSYNVSKWPEGILPKLLPGYEWSVKLCGKDGDEIFSISPLNGYFEGDFVEFSHKVGEEPAQKFMENWKYPDFVFFAILKITKGLPAAVGMCVTAMLPYRFDVDEDGNTKYTKVSDRSNTQKTIEFMNVTGADDTSLVFVDNLLPTIQKRILKNGRKLGFLMKNGYVDSFTEVYSANAADDEEDEWDTEDVPEKEEVLVVEEETQKELDWDN